MEMLLPAAWPGKRRGPAREDRHYLPRRRTAGSIDLDDAIFGLVPREDLIARMVRYQLAKRRAGTHQTLAARTFGAPARIIQAEGDGIARHGSARVPQFSRGGRAFGPVVRSHAHDLPKKLRALALKHALSAKAKDGAIIVWRKPTRRCQTKSLKRVRQAWLDQRLDHRRSGTRGKLPACARNIPQIDVLPVQGINVYDILRREKLVLTKAAIDALEARFK